MLSAHDFLQWLRPRRIGYEDIVSYVKRMDASRSIGFFSKDHHLAKVIEYCLRVGWYPIIDKPLQVVIAIPGRHHTIRAALLRYHHNSPCIGETYFAQADRYTFEGWGYHFSSRGRALVVGLSYREIGADEELFRWHKTKLLLLAEPSQR